MKRQKKYFFAMFVLMATFVYTVQPAIAGDTTTVTITGTVRANTCTVGDEAQAELEPVSVRDFKNVAGTPVGSANIPVVFTDCSAETTGVKVKVSGTAVGTDGAFKNEDEGKEGGAKNVGVYLYETDGSTLIKAGNNVDAEAQSFTTDTTLNYKASYVSTASDVGAGSVLTIITMSFTYS